MTPVVWKVSLSLGGRESGGAEGPEGHGLLPPSSFLFVSTHLSASGFLTGYFHCEPSYDQKTAWIQIFEIVRSLLQLNWMWSGDSTGIKTKQNNTKPSSHCFVQISSVFFLFSLLTC